MSGSPSNKLLQRSSAPFSIEAKIAEESKSDDATSIKNLEKTLARNLVLRQESKQRRPLSEHQRKMLEQMLEMNQSKGKSLLEELMRPEQMNNQTPYELLKKKRKQKQQGHHL